VFAFYPSFFFSFTLLTIPFRFYEIYRQKPYHLYIGLLLFCIAGMGVKYGILGVKFIII